MGSGASRRRLHSTLRRYHLRDDQLDSSVHRSWEGYAAFVEELPGLHAEGATLDEAAERASPQRGASHDQARLNTRARLAAQLPRIRLSKADFEL